MKLRKLVAFTAAAALFVGMVPAAMAETTRTPVNSKAPYGDGVYADPITGERGIIEIGEVRVGTAVNYANDYAPWDRNPSLRDLRYTAHGQTEVPVEVRFQYPLNSDNELIKLDPITVSGAINGTTQQLVYVKTPAEVYSDTYYQLFGGNYNNPTMGTEAGAKTFKILGQNHYIVWMSVSKLADAGYVPVSPFTSAASSPKDQPIIKKFDGEDYTPFFAGNKNAKTNIRFVTYEANDPAKRLYIGHYDNENPNKNFGSLDDFTPLQNAARRYDVPSAWLTGTTPRYCSLTVLVPVTSSPITVTLTGQSGNYYHGSFTAVNKGTTAQAFIKSAYKTDINGTAYSINGFTRNTVTLATALSAGTEFAFEQTLMDANGALLPDGRYTITNMKATIDNAPAGYLAPVRATGYVLNSVLTVYVTTPATSDSYHVTGELRDAAGSIKYVFDHIYTVSRSGANVSYFDVSPDTVTLKVGETKEVKVLSNAYSTGLDLTKAEFAVVDSTVATVAKNAGTNSAVVTAVKVGSTKVNVTVPGVAAPYAMVVNVVNAEGTFEESVANLTKMVVRVNTRLNVRSAPSTASSTTIVGKLQNGFIVYMDPAKSSDTWFWITYKTDIGGKSVIVQGYVSSRYLDMAN